MSPTERNFISLDSSRVIGESVKKPRPGVFHERLRYIHQIGRYKPDIPPNLSGYPFRDEAPEES